MMLEFTEWLAATPWSVALRESFVVWPILEASHVMTLMLFVGTIFMVDLRLLGWAFTRVPVSQFDRRILPWTIAGFILMVITGLLLFYAKPLTYYHNVFFRLKLLIILAGVANLALFHLKVQRSQQTWDALPRLPTAARAAGLVSILVWSGVIITGRLIAYDWYECVKLEPDSFLASFASCPATEAPEIAAGEAY